MPRQAIAIAAAAAAAVPVGGAALTFSGGGTTTAPAAASTAKIVFVDVAQGDGVVMRLGGKIVVSDAGEHNAPRVHATLLRLRAKQIDVAILSHPHDDHVKNFISLVEDFGWKIERAILTRSAWWDGTETNAALMRLLRDQRTRLEFAVRGDVFRIGSARFEVLSPPRGRFTGGASQAANVSLVYLLRVNGVRALFTGDIESTTAEAVATDLEERLDERVDLFLATHHGSKHGSVQELLNATRPRWVVISAGLGNAFGHPARETIDRLRAIRPSIWCTAADGTITATISSAGRLTWTAASSETPWWPARARSPRGRCAGFGG